MTKEPVEPDPEKTVYCVVVVDVESKRKRLKIIPLPRPDPVERTQRTDTQRSSALAKRPGKKHINYLSFRSLLKGRRRRCRFGQQKQVNQPNRTRERLPTTGGIMMGWRDNNKAGRRSRSSNLRPTLSNRIRASQKKGKIHQLGFARSHDSPRKERKSHKRKKKRNNWECVQLS